MIRAGAGMEEGEGRRKRRDGGRREGGVAEARPPRNPHNDWTVRAPDVHPAKREESTSGSDVLSGSVFCGGDNATSPMYPMIP